MSEHIAGKPNNYDKNTVIDEHLHSAANCYPTLAAAITVTGAAGAWTLGNFIEVVPVDTITSDFDIHQINIEGASADDEYELVLYATTTEIGRIRVRPDTSIQNGALPTAEFQTVIILKNTQIQAKVASSSGSADTLDISIHYHTY